MAGSRTMQELLSRKQLPRKDCCFFVSLREYQFIIITGFQPLFFYPCLSGDTISSLQPGEPSIKVHRRKKLKRIIFFTAFLLKINRKIKKYKATIFYIDFKRSPMVQTIIDITRYRTIHMAFAGMLW